MAFNIKDPETDRLLRQLAQETGESMTEAARVAFRERLERVRDADAFRKETTRAKIQAIIDEARQRPNLDDRTPEEIIGYDEYGIPA